MIESVQIKDVATYGNTIEQLTGLSKFNFIYGSNGSGKTTISRVIADENKYSTCRVTWKGGTKLQAMVYNRDFVTANFNQSNEFKGIFTLGQQNIETLNQIITAKKEIDDLTKDIQKLNLLLKGESNAGGKNGELASLEEDLKNKCWTQKQKHDAKLSGAFEGYRGNTEKFKTKILQEYGVNSAILQSLDALEKKAETIFGSEPSIERIIQKVEAENIITHENHPILKKRVLGKEDVDIAAMIKKLGNSDWIREGRSFYSANDMSCPFCQQSTTEAFAYSLNEYFDETFITDSKAIETLSTDYATDSARLQQQIASIIINASKFLDIEKIKIEQELLNSKIIINSQRLASKKKEPSQIVELESISNVIFNIKSLIDSANTKASEHNKMVSNLAKEKKDLTAQVWKYLLEVELKEELAAYDTKKVQISKAISGISESITSKTKEKESKAAGIRKLEKETTSIHPTIDAINILLSSFGFRSFSLGKASNGTCYKLVRTNGDDAQETLSEGEKTFITFLYFYYLLQGSDSESGIIIDRIVVFDDPVSSLDSDVLFLVSGLIKKLLEEVRNGIGYIKQVFVLTHNVYFHKEVVFNSKRQEFAMNEETFWVVRKKDLTSKVENCKTNPIKTSYELLWSEVRRKDRSNLTIQNTMRRILENYFKILGGVDPDKICELFDGKDKFLCKSLFSWVNDGSHFTTDDIFVSVDDETVEKYLNVFRAIFEKSKHLAHYKMMMGEAYVEVSEEEATA